MASLSFQKMDSKRVPKKSPDRLTGIAGACTAGSAGKITNGSAGKDHYRQCRHDHYRQCHLLRPLAFI